MKNGFRVRAFRLPPAITRASAAFALGLGLVGSGPVRAAEPTEREGAGRDWPVYHGDPGGTHYSNLRRIDRRNVHRLAPAWVYRCDDARERPATTIECNPLIRGGVVYLTTSGLKVVALDGATGTERWRFDPWEGRRAGGEKPLLKLGKQPMIDPATWSVVALWWGRIARASSIDRREPVHHDR